MTRRLADERGVTLIELLVAMVVMMAMFTATLLVYDNVSRDYRRTERHNEAQQQVRMSIDRMARELRNLAAPSDFANPLGTYPNSVEKNDKYDFVFKTVEDLTDPPGSNPVGVMRVRYCLDATDPAAGKLYRQVQAAASFTTATPSTATCPAAGWTTSTVVTDAVVNRAGGLDRPLFTYSTAGALIPYNDPDAITDTTRVAAEVVVDPTPTSAPKAATLSTSVLLRNQNRRPTASFTVTVAGRSVELNAAESNDPEEERLEYEWYEDGVLRTDWTSVVVRHAYTTAGTHTYKLVVRDPAKLFDESPEQTVTLP